MLKSIQAAVVEDVDAYINPVMNPNSASAIHPLEFWVTCAMIRVITINPQRAINPCVVKYAPSIKRNPSKKNIDRVIRIAPMKTEGVRPFTDCPHKFLD